MTTPLHHYLPDTDGCDETFDVYRESTFLISIPFWEEADAAEALARHVVAALNAADQLEAIDE